MWTFWCYPNDSALTDLINENIIYSVPKVGSFVCKKSRFKSFDGLNSVTEDCAKKKEDCTSHVVLNELEEATDLMKKEPVKENFISSDIELLHFRIL